jgi:hypothetical protein
LRARLVSSTPSDVEADRTRYALPAVVFEDGRYVLHLPERRAPFVCARPESLSDGSARRTLLPLSSAKTRRTESTSTNIPLLPIGQPLSHSRCLRAATVLTLEHFHPMKWSRQKSALLGGCRPPKFANGNVRGR